MASGLPKSVENLVIAGAQFQIEADRGGKSSEHIDAALQALKKVSEDLKNNTHSDDVIQQTLTVLARIGEKAEKGTPIMDEIEKIQLLIAQLEESSGIDTHVSVEAAASSSSAAAASSSDAALQLHDPSASYLGEMRKQRPASAVLKDIESKSLLLAEKKREYSTQQEAWSSLSSLSHSLTISIPKLKEINELKQQRNQAQKELLSLRRKRAKLKQIAKIDFSSREPRIAELDEKIRSLNGEIASKSEQIIPDLIKLTSWEKKDISPDSINATLNSLNTSKKELNQVVTELEAETESIEQEIRSLEVELYEATPHPASSTPRKGQIITNWIQQYRADPRSNLEVIDTVNIKVTPQNSNSEQTLTISQHAQLTKDPARSVLKVNGVTVFDNNNPIGDPLEKLVQGIAKKVPAEKLGQIQEALLFLNQGIADQSIHLSNLTFNQNNEGYVLTGSPQEMPDTPPDKILVGPAQDKGSCILDYQTKDGDIVALEFQVKFNYFNSDGEVAKQIESTIRIDFAEGFEEGQATITVTPVSQEE